MSIQKFLQEYAAREISRWHTPGHKGILNPLDITELANHSFPASLIDKAEKKAAKFYGANKVRFLTNGSSIGIKAAILAIAEDMTDGDIILSHRECHSSVYQGANLAKVKLRQFHEGNNESDDGIWIQPRPDTVEAALKKYSNAKAVILESPDYFGRIIDPSIPDMIKKAGKLFICDAAHGAHFPAHSGLFPKSYSGIADVCNLSAHKTLDAYTQTAYLCVNNEKLISKIDDALEDLGTTSPSYLFFASLETAIETAKKNKTKYERLKKDIDNFKKDIPCLQNDDFTRIVVNAAGLGLNALQPGWELFKRLVQENIMPETYCGDYVVFIATPHEKKEDFEKLWAAIKKVTR